MLIPAQIDLLEITEVGAEKREKRGFGAFRPFCGLHGFRGRNGASLEPVMRFKGSRGGDDAFLGLAVGPNLLANPGFENGATSWTLTPGSVWATGSW